MPERKHAKAIIGMVHLRPLPGSPRWGGSMAEVLSAAAHDAHALQEGGVDAVVVENYGDTPFFPGRVPAETVAAMTRAVDEVRRTITLPVGVNVLRNDAASALAVCAATNACMIRVNVHTGAMLTDQGWINGSAHETVRIRRHLQLDVAILADILVKHATAPAGLSIEAAARDTWERGHADALIVSGSGTGRPTSPQDAERTRCAVPDAQILIGSGLTALNAPELLRHADGAIVGTAFKRDGHAETAVSLDCVRRLMDVVAGISA
ncbi:MAG TPA: BtpA/SgcQ family protein [Longimicrobiales bacterium]